MSEFDEMIAVCNKAIENDPNNADAYNGRGMVYLMSGQYDAAISDLSYAAEKLDPNNADTYKNLGMAYAKKALWELSLKNYTKAVELNPKDAASHGGCAYANYRMNQFEKAIAGFCIAIDELGSKGIMDFYFRGDAYRRTNQWDLARADLKKVLELDPSHKGAISSLKAVESLERIL